MDKRSLLVRYADLRTKVLARLRKVNTLTERGTMDAGTQLQEVVATARTHITHLRDLLVGATNSSLQRAIATHSDHVRSHGAALDLAVAAHASEVAMVAESARQIRISAKEIERANSKAKVLSINVRIESAREGATVFKAISVEMSELSRSISSANGRIQALAVEMEATLPRLVAQSEALRAMVDDFTSGARVRIDQIDCEVIALRASAQESLEVSDRALKEIVAASYAGLSALQFQDVCAQSLLQIDSWQATALIESTTELGVEFEVEPKLDSISEEERILDHGPAEGEVLLF